MRRRSYAAIALAMIGLAAGITVSRGAARHAISVIDGDTIRVGGDRWRLTGFDTPETYNARCEAEYRAGVAATAALEKLLSEARTVEPAATGRLDRYGRTLGRLYIDGRDVGEILIERGLAVAHNGRTKRRDWCS